MKGAQFESHIRLYKKCIHGLNVTYVRYEKKIHYLLLLIYND